MSKLVLAFFILLAGVGSARAAEQQKTFPKELVQYVLDAKKLGLTDAQIQQNAIKAGWPAVRVREAMDYTVPAMAGELPSSKPAVAEKPTAALAAKAAGEPGLAPPTNSVPANMAQREESARGRRNDDAYEIGAGDILQVSVWKQPDVSVPNAVVRPDGKISMPLLKDVQVLGLTTVQAETTIKERISKYINTPDVTVVVTEINSKKVYVVGGVKKEGPIPYTYQMSVMQAISEAGGLNDYAKRKRIYVLRLENGKQYKLPFNYDAVVKGQHMELNIPLLAGDTLVVPQ